MSTTTSKQRTAAHNEDTIASTAAHTVQGWLLILRQPDSYPPVGQIGAYRRSTVRDLHRGQHSRHLHPCPVAHPHHRHLPHLLQLCRRAPALLGCEPDRDTPGRDATQRARQEP